MSLSHDLYPYLIPPTAAAISVIPVFHGFAVKSAQQAGLPLPRFAPFAGFKAAPTIGGITGIQMITQGTIESVLSKQFQPGLIPMVTSAVITGAVSAPALAIFNGQTMGQSVVQSLRALSLKQAGAIVTRETSFLFSLRFSGPLNSYMKEKLGDKKSTALLAAFTSGTIGSLIGHPADTALTMWQRGIRIESWQQLMRGSPVRAFTIGIFAVCYQTITTVAKHHLK